jgi:hypothetical protein
LIRQNWRQEFNLAIPVGIRYIETYGHYATELMGPIAGLLHGNIPGE